MDNTETQEMYLVTIDKLAKKQGIVRNIDIANERGFSKSTVHSAMKNLESMGLINFAPGDITLTELGKMKAEELEEKHALIVKGLLMLGIPEDVAEINANKMEHVLTDEVYEVLCKHVAMGEQLTTIMKMHGKSKTNDDEES